jgi:hypothetical protein
MVLCGFYIFTPRICDFAFPTGVAGVMSAMTGGISIVVGSLKAIATKGASLLT